MLTPMTFNSLTKDQPTQEADALSLMSLRFSAAMEHMKFAVYLFDHLGQLSLANERTRQLLGLNASDSLAGMTIQDFSASLFAKLGPLANGHVRVDAFAATARARDKCSLNLSFQSGQVVQVSHSPMRDGGFIQTIEDVTERRKAEARANHLASHDGLTNLPNRRLLKQHIDVALNDSQADCAVLCIAVDRFKSVNDSLGHAGGDALLVAVTKRLAACVRASDTVGRLGGNEFVILAANVRGRDEIVALAERVVDEMGKPFDIQGQSVIVGASVGIALAPNDGDNPDRLIKRADMALFEAKRDSAGCYSFFEPILEVKARERQALENDLRKAVLEQQFELHYQPVFAARQRKLIGFEALLRWNHPTRGRVSPVDFIPVAEELGLITELGDWVIQQACKTAAAWPDHIYVAVNVSARQFINHDLVGVIKQALADTGLPASRLEIEITESALMESGGEIATILQRLRSQGIGIAMDDFGTGYSSLAYLRRFHFTKVKIDRSFISGLETEEQSIAIVRAIIALCKSMNLVVTAEGVETELQADILRLENCDYLQGFLLGRPMPGVDVPALFSPAEPVRLNALPQTTY